MIGIKLKNKKVMLIMKKSVVFFNIFVSVVFSRDKLDF